ncbi:MAG: hypothetical protein ABFS46_03840 [Myxococcota bacterium]
MPDWLVVLVGLLVLGAMLASTAAGRRLRQRLPVVALRAGRAPKEDREYLLRVCNGDRVRVERLLEIERARRPDLTEAEAYRKAIRTHLRQT